MNDLVWLIPLVGGLCALAYGFIRAPYDMYLAKEREHDAITATLRAELKEARMEIARLQGQLVNDSDNRERLRKMTALIAMARVEGLDLFYQQIEADGFVAWNTAVQAWAHATSVMLSQSFDASTTVRFAQPPSRGAINFNRGLGSEHNASLMSLHYRIEFLDTLSDELRQQWRH